MLMLRAIPDSRSGLREGRRATSRPHAVGASFRFTARFVRVQRAGRTNDPARPPVEPDAAAARTAPERTDGAPAGGRLNLLLSHGGWQQESWADRLPRLLEPFGVQSMRVGSGREATNVLEHNPVHIAVVDLTLPLDGSRTQPNWPGVADDEAGVRLLHLLARHPSRPPTVVVRAPRSSRDDTRVLCEALRGGVFAVVDRPVNLELMLEVFRRALRRHYADRWPTAGPN